jgi:hypothetical protein
VDYEIEHAEPATPFSNECSVGVYVAATGFLRKYRIIEWCSNEKNFSRMQTAKTEGYLEGNRGFCRQQTAEIQPLMCREHCAVFP